VYPGADIMGVYIKLGADPMDNNSKASADGKGGNG
jgi:hypothetical protein